MNNTTGVKYKFDSVTVSNTNSNVQCIPSIAENSIIEPGASSFTIQVKYKSGVTITDKTDVCEIKYEFSIYDMTPPTLSVTLVSSTETTRTVKIIAQDEADGYLKIMITNIISQQVKQNLQVENGKLIKAEKK